MEDTSHYKPKNPNPREKASLLSYIGFAYTFPLFIYGYRKRITEDDLYETYSAHKSSILGEKCIKLWDDELKNSSKMKTPPSLRKVFMKLLGRDYLLLSIGIAFCELFCRPTQVCLLGELIMCYSENGGHRKPYVYALGIVICMLVNTLLAHPVIMECNHLALKIRVICCSLIYRKALKLSKTALIQTTPGKIINLISNDVSIFDRIIFTSMYLWAAPAQTIIVLCVMYNEVGVSSFFGVAVLIFFIPLYYALAKAISRTRLKASTKGDQRLRLMNEIIQGIYVIKMYAWEIPFSKIVAKLRKGEVHFLKLGLYIKSVYLAHPVINASGLFVTITSMVLLNQNLNAKSLFIMINLFFFIGVSLNFTLPQSLVFLHELFVAFRRITDFLLSDETEERTVSVKTNSAIVIQNCTAKWDKSSENNILSNLNLEIESNNLTAIIGPVGSGKSSLLSIMLGEMSVTAGQIDLNGSVSYASQEPWIFSSTVRQNILFGSDMNEQRYNNVIKCCALEPDLSLLPYGDKTTIGEKGISLSGGQKARISLARAIYREANIYLLDDPLSAVDAQVGKQIFEQCIQKFLNNKTVILVTHQLQYLSHVNYIVVLDSGAVSLQGTKTDLEKSTFDFVKYLQSNSEDSVEISENHAAPTQLVQTSHLERNKETIGKSTRLKFVSFATYKDYLLVSKNYLLLATTLLIFIVAQFFASGSIYYLSYWANMEEMGKFSNYKEGRDIYIYIYSGITIIAIILAFFRSFCSVNLAKESSKVLHDVMFKNVVHAKAQFFSLNASGVILNRFAKDMGITDDILPASMMVAFRIILSILGIFVVISIVNPLFLIPSVLILITLYYLRKLYLTTHLNVLRVEGQVRGPLYSYVNTSLQGLATIRAFEKQKLLQQEFYYHQDIYSSAWFTSLMSSATFACWLDLTVVLYIAILSMYYSFNADTYGSNIGLVISQAMQLVGSISYGVKSITDVETFMISVERILEYNSIERERGIKHPAIGKPSPSWPDHGEIKFQNVYVRYSQTYPYVLKDINLTIRPLEKIGIVGRTGAGKSSIISALFQLVETEGSIIIDNVNIETVQLHDLRTKLSTIPQDPVLFSGSMRYNLDPFDEYDDNVLWKALEDVQLRNVVDNLESEITIDGSNFSVGQRQLICLARAIVRNNKILILDEATANVDLETDAIIQKTIRNKFSHCTVVTVAHRLNTVIDSDRILVMDEGMAIEFAHPHLLLQNKNGAFYNLVQQTEAVMAESLIEIARENYNRIKQETHLIRDT